MKIAPHWLRWPETQTLIHTFGADTIRFVGGCVRDAVLGRDVRDVDAAIVLTPQQVVNVLREHAIKAIPTGIDHGTVTAVIGRKQFEITTLRRDVSTDGRRATVAYTDDWREDAARRDFTMNALYCDASGEVTDFFGGVDDARKGCVKFIGEAKQRIHEDALRILRFFRFFAHYGEGEIDKEGLYACETLAHKIDSLSGERIQQEMFKLLMADRAANVVEIMQQHSVLLPVLGCGVTTSSLVTLPRVLKMAETQPDAILALAVLLRSTDGERLKHVAHISARWKLSNVSCKRLRVLVTSTGLAEADDAAHKRYIRALGKQDFVDVILLCATESAEYDSALAAVRLAQAWQIPVFPVTGGDLKTHGLLQGKAMGEALKMLEAKWEDGGYVASKEELLRELQ